MESPFWRKEFLQGPYEWWDNQNIRTDPRSLCPKHNSTDVCLRLNGWPNTSWAEEKFRSGGLNFLVVPAHVNGHLKATRATVIPKSPVTNGQKFQGSTIFDLLKECIKRSDLDNGSRIHADMVQRGFLKHNIYAASALINMYAQCGAVAEAQEVFNELPSRDVVSWTALIGGYVKYGHANEAIRCFDEMQSDDICPDGIMLSWILKACSSICMPDKGFHMHVEVVRQGLLEKDIVLGTALVDMYAKCGALSKAQELFDKLPTQDLISWTTLISGYVQHGHGEEAISCFEMMQAVHYFPDEYTFASILKACGSIGAIHKGQEIHTCIVKEGPLEENNVVGTALVDMYAKCGLLAEAQKVFDRIPAPDTFPWTALISGYAQDGCSTEAISRFEQMQLKGFSPHALTFASVLKSYGDLGNSYQGEEIHARIVGEALLEGNIILGTALVDMYAKCGMLAKAEYLFDELQLQDDISWNVLIAGYTQHGHDEAAIVCYNHMQSKGHLPNAVTFACLLKACGGIGALYMGQELHVKNVTERMVENNTVIGTALIDMYGKCGALSKAQEVFDELSQKDTILWNALIAAYALFGKDEIVFNTFNDMIGKGQQPDFVTFIVLLNICSHTGLLEKGQMFLEMMNSCYNVIPTSEHHNCMIDLFGRTGDLEKSVTVIKEMPFAVNLIVWRTMLGACQKWGNVGMGRMAFENAVQMDEKDAALYVSICNTFTGAGVQACVG